jgi:hypothetical protein
VIRVLPGDCREVLATLPADSVDAAGRRLWLTVDGVLLYARVRFPFLVV